MRKTRYSSRPKACRAIADELKVSGRPAGVDDRFASSRFDNHTIPISNASNMSANNQSGRFSMFGIPAAETRCDMDYTHRKSEGFQAYQMLLTKRKINPYTEPTFDPIWGSGEPVIDYFKTFEKQGPCMQEILVAHEEAHKKLALVPCRELKKCIDASDQSWFGGRFGKEVSLYDYIDCLNKNYKGLPANCDADEQAAYAETVKIARQIKNETRCQAELNDINRNLPEWENAAKSYKC